MIFLIYCAIVWLMASPPLSLLLLFVGGVMNLVWIAGLSILVLIEKLLPYGMSLRVPIGVLLMIAGAALIFPTMTGWYSP